MKPAMKDQVLVTFEDLTYEGNGVAKINGYPIFVPNALPEEKAVIEIISTGKEFGKGKIISIETSSNQRIQPPCTVFDTCGGCQIQHVAYQEQLTWKQDQVQQALGRIGKIKDAKANATIGMDAPFFYRNKMTLSVNENQIGYFQERTHLLVEFDTCHIVHPKLNELLNMVKVFLKNTPITSLQQIVLRVAETTEQTMIVFVSTSYDEKEYHEFVKRFAEANHPITSIIHLNEKTKREKTLFGVPYITEEVKGMKFYLSAQSFFQVNPKQTNILIEQLKNLIPDGKEQVLVDAHCGVGTLGLSLVDSVKEVIGIDLMKEAIQDAKTNAQLNQITNASFLMGKAEEVLPEITAHKQIDIVLLDPPRGGCDTKLLQAILEHKPQQILYVSCNPATLARDLAILQADYSIESIQPIDMFPQTSHVETVVLIERK
jgi:23S rRNA (uracil1939-C5)-methyltransferase